MNLDERRVGDLRHQLQMELAELTGTLQSVAGKERGALEERIAVTRDRLAALSQIVLRYSNALTQVRQSVFVSTNFKAGGGVPRWVKRIFKKVNLYAKESAGPYELIYGNTEAGGDFQESILEGIVNSYCFLSLVGTGRRMTETDEQRLLRPYLQEEIGVAFALAKPIVVAVQEPIDPTQIGLLYGGNRQRIVFSIEGDWEDDLARRLARALQTAPRIQARIIQERRKIVERLFF